MAPLTQLSIDVQSLSDNSKKMEVEGAIAVGEKVGVTLSGLPDGVDPSADELRLRVLGPMGEDLAVHPDWEENIDGKRITYTTTLTLATVQAYQLFFPPIPFPPPPRAPHTPKPIPSAGYDPVLAAAAARPASSIPVRLLLELREKPDEDSSDSDLDASLLGTANIRLNYWPVDWQTATLVDLANGKVYSKSDVDALLADKQDTISDLDSIRSGAAKGATAYQKPSGGVPKTDLSASVQASLSKADTALQRADLAAKADLVDGKVPSSELPSYVDDVLEYASLSAFPATGESGKIYVALDTNKTYRWSGTQYTEIAKSVDVVAPSTSASDSGKAADAKATGDALAGKASTADATLTEIYPWTVVAAYPTTIEWGEFEGITGWMPKNNGQTVGFPKGDASSTSLSWNASANPPEAGYDITATRSGPFYQLGSQSDKPLALARDYALKSEIPDVPVKAVKRNGTALTPDANGAVDVTVPTTAADVGAANQTAIAAAFTAKEYAVGELATYNGLLYRCKTEYEATASSAKPDADTTHWEAAVVAVLLDGKLSTSGGIVGGNLFVSGVIQGESDVIAPNGSLVVGTVGVNATNFYTMGIRTEGHGAPIQYPTYTGDGRDFFALIQHIAANFSTSASYVLGQLVVYEGTLYRCTTAHSAGAWNANDFTAATVEDALAAIRAAIPAAQVNADWNAVSGVAQILNKPTIPNPNLLTYTSGTTLDPATAVYRSALNADGTFPTITDTAIPSASAYYQFELEMAVPSTVPSTITGPSGWTWIDGHGLPDPADLSGGETICISVRLDCTARTFLASVWRVA